MRVIELRNYRLTEDRGFIRYFEEHFLFSQRAEGMYRWDSSRSSGSRTASCGSEASRTCGRGCAG